MSPQSLRNWVKQSQLDRHERDDGLTTDERAELTRLRRENARLQQERDLLKRATVFFAAEIVGARLSFDVFGKPAEAVGAVSSLGDPAFDC